jgi:shikimate dehydrogenase
MDSITGNTKIYAILGDPINQVGSPASFNREFQKRGHDGVLVAMKVAAGDLSQAVAGLRTVDNLAGVIFTIPHKMAAAHLVDELGSNGRLVGTINAARREPDGRWVGDLFDGRGCVAAARDAGHTLRGRSVLQVGAGGVGRAIAFAFAEAGITRLSVSDLDSQRASRLVADVAAAFPSVATQQVPPPARPAAHHDLIINASPLGMSETDPLPIPAESLRANMLVIDVVHTPATIDTPTALLAAAADAGCQTQNGRAMHLAQITEIADFFGATAERLHNAGGRAGVAGRGSL